MANNKQYKQYTINNALEACTVLSGMIAQVIMHLDKYIEYSIEAAMLLKKQRLTMCQQKNTKI